MRVLSLFDGIACGRLALERAGIPVEAYYASEIDNHAISVASRNWSDIIQLGDVENWRDWDIGEIDLIMAGSPCQGFSNCGKGLAFDDPRSKLFFRFVECIQELKPKYFLLENVKMKKEWIEEITSHVGVDPVIIDSSLVSAQNRKRLYWANWDFDQPEDRNVIVPEILQVNIDDEYRVDASRYEHLIEGAGVIDDYNQNFRKFAEKTYTLTPNTGSKTFRNGQKLAFGKYIVRMFTPVECERLQTLPDGYTEGISDRQRYKALGNGWTVDVIAHILRELKSSL